MGFRLALLGREAAFFWIFVSIERTGRTEGWGKSGKAVRVVAMKMKFCPRIAGNNEVKDNGGSLGVTW